MFRMLASLTTLITAASLVNMANSTLTTVMPLRMLEDGASGTMVALFGAAFFLGFAVGCFSQPPVIQRVGYIRAFAAAAGLCTMLAVVMDLTDSVRLWLVLRFFMGFSVAAIFAAVDGWINGTATDTVRGKVFAAYGWCLGASAVLSQLLLMRFDGMMVGFITVLALAFNLALVMVAMTRTPAPIIQADEQRYDGLIFTSTVSVATAVYAGLVTAAILSTLPAVLAEGGIDEIDIGAALGAFFLGRLILQIPFGIIADRMDLRLLVAIVAGFTGTVVLLGALLISLGMAQVSSEEGRANWFLFLVIMTLLGGLVLPLYTLANSLAFARAEGRPVVRIATSLLLVNSAGAVLGPLLTAAATPILATNALTLVIALASAVMVVIALHGRRMEGASTAVVSMSPIPVTSVTSNRTMAQAKFESTGSAEGQTSQ